MKGVETSDLEQVTTGLFKLESPFLEFANKTAGKLSQKTEFLKNGKIGVTEQNVQGLRCMT